MDTIKSLGSGIAGSLVLTGIHETMKRVIPNAPRMDHLGMQVLKKIKQSAGIEGTDDETLYKESMIGDLALNTAFYSMVGTGKNAWWRGLALGASAGIAAVFLPKWMELDEDASSKSNATAAMTIGLYSIAGLAAAGANAILRIGEK